MDKVHDLKIVNCYVLFSGRQISVCILRCGNESQVLHFAPLKKATYFDLLEQTLFLLCYWL